MEVSDSNQINEEQIADQMNDINNDNNKINEDNLNALNGEADDYVTDSDGDNKDNDNDNDGDKYMSHAPTSRNNNNNNNTINNVNTQHMHTTSSLYHQQLHHHQRHHPNLILHTASSSNEIFGTPSIHDKLRSMQSDIDIREKQFREVVNENTLLKTELLTLQDTLTSKTALIEEYESTFESTNLKLKQLSETVSTLQKQKDNLLQQVNEYETELQKQKILHEDFESHSKSLNQFKEHVATLQNEYSKKETNLTLKYKEKENEIKLEFTQQLAKLTQQVDELTIENEKLKFELSNNKINIDTYITQIEEKETTMNEQLRLKNKELQKQSEIINEYEQQLATMQKTFQKQKQLFENDIEQLTHQNKGITAELDDKSNMNYDMQSKLNELSQQYESVCAQFKECTVSLTNKDKVIEQLKHQIESMNNEMLSRETEFDMHDKQKHKDVQEYTTQLQLLIDEKTTVEKLNAELNENLMLANDKIKELRDFINDKFNSMKHTLYKENCKNQNLENKFKGVIRQMKQREKSLIEENMTLKEMLSDKDVQSEQMEQHYQNQIKNISFYHAVNPSSATLNTYHNGNSNVSNNQQQQHQLEHNNSAVNTRGNYNLNVSHYNVGGSNSYYGLGISNGNRYGSNVYDDPKEEEQKKTLEDFKMLLNNIDEKLDLPEITEGNGYY
jgi:chromosome segregation ATPase